LVADLRSPGGAHKSCSSPLMSPSSRLRSPSSLRLRDLFIGTWTGLVLLFLYLPIAVLMAYSFNASRLNVVWEGFTFSWYRRVWENGPLLEAARNSLIIAIVTTILSVVLGTLGAWLLHRYRFRAAGSIETLAAVPMVMPEILMGISLL